MGCQYEVPRNGVDAGRWTPYCYQYGMPIPGDHKMGLKDIVKSSRWGEKSHTDTHLGCPSWVIMKWGLKIGRCPRMSWLTPYPYQYNGAPLWGHHKIGCMGRYTWWSFNTISVHLHYVYYITTASQWQAPTATQQLIVKGAATSNSKYMDSHWTCFMGTSILSWLFITCNQMGR